MSESLTMLTETADKLFADLAAKGDAPLETIWPALEETGFSSLLVPEAEGGFGGDWQDAFAVLRLAGFHALAAPLAEAVLAGQACVLAGLPPVDGLTTIAERVAIAEQDDVSFTGVMSGVPWGRAATHVLAWTPHGLIRLRVADAVIAHRSNLPGEPRDVLSFDAAPMETGAVVDLFVLGALARTAQIAGALDRALGLSIAHANERVQFGKPISKFQAVQQALAVFAEEAAAANCAGQAAARSMDGGEARFEIAAAKLRAGLAAEAGAAVAHQVHGAIGFTRDHALHRFTTRLAAWRTEFGADRVWAERIAAMVAEAGAEGLWPMITARSDAVLRAPA